MSIEAKQQSTSRKRKRNLLDDEKDNCGCRSGCSKRSCSCFKSSNGCNSSCRCSSSCKNVFNRLDYFFGENSECTANHCFSDWLAKNVKTADEVKNIDRDALRQKIMNCGRFSEVLDDEEFKKWSKKMESN